MDPSALGERLQALLNRDLYRLGEQVITPWILLAAVAVLLVGWIVGRSLRRLAARAFKAESEEEEGTSAVAEPVAFWLPFLTAAALSLDLLGLDWAGVRALVDAPLLTISGTVLTLATVITALLVVFLSWVLSRLLRNWASRGMRARGVDTGTQGITKRLIHYSVMAVGLAIGLDNLGVNLAALFAAGAVFAVGIGFAMQNIAQNFVSGLILLIERSIKPGDVLEVEGTVVIVERMGIRTTVARTRDEEEIIIPNATLVQNSVKNYTLRDSLYRLRAQVGVEYASDVRQVMQVLAEAAEGLQWRFKGRDPLVFLTEFGDSSVVFEVSVWVSDPWQAPRRRSELMQAVWWAVQDAGITIAFPQVDVHFDPPVEESLERLPRAS